MALADKFCGKVDQEEYQQALCKELVVAAWTLWTGRFCRQTFRFEGCTDNEAHCMDGSSGTTSITVTDVSGRQYTDIPLRSKFEDSSHGSGVIPKEVVTVARARTSPHMWTLTVTRTGCTATNGSTTLSGPTWMPY